MENLLLMETMLDDPNISKLACTKFDEVLSILQCNKI